MAEPTVEEALRFLRKLSLCESDAAKLILLKNFMARAERAPEPEGTPTCYYCHKPIAGTVYAVSFQNGPIHWECYERAWPNRIKLVPEAGESPSSASDQAHLPTECKRRTCAHHRDIWRHYEDEIASNSELRNGTQQAILEEFRATLPSEGTGPTK